MSVLHILVYQSVYLYMYMYIIYQCCEYQFIPFIHSRIIEVLVLSNQNEANVNMRVQVGNLYHANQLRD